MKFHVVLILIVIALLGIPDSEGVFEPYLLIFRRFDAVFLLQRVP